VVVGAKIRDLRKKLGLTQEQLAGNELTKSYVSQVELGRIHPSEKALRIMARRLGKPLGYFLENTDDLRTIDVLLKASQALWSTGRLDEGVNGLNEALHLAERTGREDVLARIRTIMGQLELVRGNWQKAEHHLETALSLVHGADYPVQWVQTATTLGIAAGRLGLYHKAVQAFQYALDYALKLPDEEAEIRSQALSCYGDFCYGQGHWLSAIELYQAALKSQHRLPPARRAELHASLACALWQAERREEAQHTVSLAEADMAAIHDPEGLALAQIAMARAYATTLQYAPAQDLLHYAIGHFSRDKNPEAEAAAWETRLWLAWKTKDLPLLLQYHDHAKNLPSNWPWNQVKVQGLRFLGLVTAEENPAQALSYFDEALRLADPAERLQLQLEYWLTAWRAGQADAPEQIWTLMREHEMPSLDHPLIIRPWRLQTLPQAIAQ